jgi:sugar/nucleoside kinase (ribokinase family)
MKKLSEFDLMFANKQELEILNAETDNPLLKKTKSIIKMIIRTRKKDCRLKLVIAGKVKSLTGRLSKEVLAELKTHLGTDS